MRSLGIGSAGAEALVACAPPCAVLIGPTRCNNMGVALLAARSGGPVTTQGGASRSLPLLHSRGTAQPVQQLPSLADLLRSPDALARLVAAGARRKSRSEITSSCGSDPTRQASGSTPGGCDHTQPLLATVRRIIGSQRQRRSAEASGHRFPGVGVRREVPS
jgi:hypothetical protein